MSDPTPAMKQRSQAWLTVVDHVETYLKAAAQRYDGIWAATNQLSRDMPQPDDLEDQFAPLGKGGIQDLFAKLWWDLNLPDGKAAENASGIIKNKLLTEITQLKEDLNRTISDFSDMSASFHPSESDVAPTKTAVMRDPSLQKRIDEYLRSISAAESGKQPEIDPYILKLGLDRKIETSVRKLNRQADSYAYVQDATKRVDGEVTERLQTILRRYTEVVEQNAHIIAGGAQAVRSVFVNQPKLFEYKHWLSSSKAPSHFSGSVAKEITQREEGSELRYPKENSAYAQAIRVGTLERRTKFLHTYSAGEYVLTPLSLIEIRQNSPAWSIDLVGAKLLKDHKAAQDENQFVVQARQHGSSSGKMHSFVFRAKVAANWIRDLEAITTGSLPIPALGVAKSQNLASTESPSSSAEQPAPAYDAVQKSPAAPASTESASPDADSSGIIPLVKPNLPSQSDIGSGYTSATTDNTTTETRADPLSASHVSKTGDYEPVAAAPITHEAEPAAAGKNTLTAAPLTANPDLPTERQTASGESHIAAAPVGAVFATDGHEVTPATAPLNSGSARNVDVAAGSLNTATTANTSTSTKADQRDPSHIGKSDEHGSTWNGEVSAAPITHEASTAGGHAPLAAAPIHTGEQSPVARQTEAADQHIAAAPVAPVAGVSASTVTPSAAPIVAVAGNKIGDTSDRATTANTDTSTSAKQFTDAHIGKSDEHAGTWNGEVSAAPISHEPTSNAAGGHAPLTAAPFHSTEESPAAKQTEAAEQHIAAAPMAPGAGSTSSVTPSAAPITAAAGNKIGDTTDRATTANTRTSTTANQLTDAHIGKSDEHAGTWNGEVSAAPINHEPTSNANAGHAPLTAAPFHDEKSPVSKQTEAAEQHIAAAPIAPSTGGSSSGVTPSAAPITTAAGNKIGDTSNYANTANTGTSTSADQLTDAHIGKSGESTSAWHGEPVAAVPVTHEQPAATAGAAPLTAFPIHADEETPVAKQTEAAEQHIAAAPMAAASSGTGVTPSAAPITGTKGNTFDVHAGSVNAATTDNTDIGTEAARRSSSAVANDTFASAWDNEHVAAIPLTQEATPNAGANSEAPFYNAKEQPEKSQTKNTPSHGSSGAPSSNVTPAVIPITAVANGSNDVPSSSLNSATTSNTHTGTSADKLSAEHVAKSGEDLGSKSGWHSEPVAAAPVTHEPTTATPVSLTAAPLATEKEPVARQTKAAAQHVTAAPIPVDSGAAASKVTATAAPLPTDSSIAALADDSDSEISDVAPYDDEGTLAWKAEKDMAEFDRS